MRFCDLFTPTVHSLGSEQALAPHKRIEAKFCVQCDQPHFVVFFLCTISPRRIMRPAPSPKNLTEFPFARNFSKHDLEVL
jgi:hypothetical protein